MLQLETVTKKSSVLDHHKIVQLMLNSEMSKFVDPAEENVTLLVISRFLVEMSVVIESFVRNLQWSGCQLSS
jgi:hypothetical protein